MPKQSGVSLPESPWGMLADGGGLLGTLAEVELTWRKGVDGKVRYPTAELFADVLGLILRLF